MAVNIKDANMGEIVKVLRKYSSVSAKEISAMSGLSIPSVTKYLNDMLKEGILLERVNLDTVAGRKPKVYSLNPDCRSIVVIDLGSTSVRVGIADLSGALLFHGTCPITDTDHPQSCISCVISFVQNFLDQSGIDRKNIGCFVIGNPGVVDPESGTMRLNADFAVWSILPVRKMFMDAFQKQVLIYNDVNLSAIGERIYGVGKGYENFIYIRDDVGLKAGIVINGSLYEGERHAAGEIGLNYLMNDSLAVSDASDAGCVESKVSMHSFIREIKQKLPEYPDDTLSALANNNPEAVTFGLIEKALHTSDTFVREIVERYAKFLAVSVANLALTLDIGLIVFGGEIIQLHEYLLKPMRQRLAQLLDYPPTVLLSELNDQACIYGAISTGQEFIYQNLI